MAVVDQQDGVLLYTEESGLHIAEKYRCRLIADVCAKHNAQVAAPHAGSVGGGGPAAVAAEAEAKVQAEAEV